MLVLTFGSSVNAATPTPIAAPTNVRVVVGAGVVTFSWSAPALQPGQSISDYHLEYRAAGDSNAWIVAPHPAFTSTSYSTTANTNASPVIHLQARVAAVDSRGVVGAKSAAANFSVGKPAPPPPPPAGPVYSKKFVSTPVSTLMTRQQMVQKNLSIWADGNMGVVAKGNGQFDFYAANYADNRGLTAKTSGSLTNPAASISYLNGTIQNVKEHADYAGGGPIYKDPKTGHLLQFYHAENYIGDFWYASLGIAISKNNGASFTDTGRIIKHNHRIENLTEINGYEILGSPYVIKDGYFYVYFADRMANNAVSRLAVARAPVDQVMAAAEKNQTVPWKKYYQGSFSQPGVHGLSSPLENQNAGIGWMDVAYSTYLDQIVMVLVGFDYKLYVMTSDDGINWGKRELLGSGNDDKLQRFYPTIVSTGPDPKVINREFYVYSIGGPRWEGAHLDGQLVTIPIVDAPAKPVDVINTVNIGTTPIAKSKSKSSGSSTTTSTTTTTAETTTVPAGTKTTVLGKVEVNPISKIKSKSQVVPKTPVNKDNNTRNYLLVLITGLIGSGGFAGFKKFGLRNPFRSNTFY